MDKKKLYEPPAVRKVRLDIKGSVLGYCQTTSDMIMANLCDTPEQCPNPRGW